MKLHYYLNVALALHAKNRPPEYLAEYEKHIVKRDADGFWVNEDTPAWREMMRRYAPAREEEAKRAGIRLTVEIEPLPREQWPLAIRFVATLAEPGEKGVGDTVARLAGKLGLAFKAAYKKVTGEDCGCNGRQDWMNRRYPYVTSP